MTNHPVDVRVAAILTLRERADALMNAMKHTSMREQVGVAVRDLDEADHWFEEPNIAERPYLLAIVDINITSATSRLDMVDGALKTYGPNAMLIG